MLSKIHFWIVVAVRWARLLFRSDKRIVLQRLRDRDGVVTCDWQNALWIELPSGRASLSVSWISSKPVLATEGYVTIHGFFRRQSYSVTALLLNESFAIQPFQYVFDERKIAFQKRQLATKGQPVRVSAGIRQVKFKSIKINHNTFSKPTLP